MGVLNIILDILAILVIIALGSALVVALARLILFFLDHKKQSNDHEEKGRVVNEDDIVVYSNQENPNRERENAKAKSAEDEEIQEIDYDKAVEEQNRINASRQPQQDRAPKKVEQAPEQDEVFWDNDEDEEFNGLLDEVIAEAKKPAGEEKEEKPEEQKEEVVENNEPSETDKELAELKALKEQQQKEIEEFKQMKEDFAREKEEELAMLKEDLNKAKEEEIEKIRQDALKEQEKLEQMKKELEEEKNKEPEVDETVEPIVQQTAIKDEEELNKMKYKNLMRMNQRLTRIIRDTDRLAAQKQKAIEKQEQERRKAEERAEQERQKEIERQNEIERQERERQEKIAQEEAERKAREKAEREEQEKKLREEQERIQKQKAALQKSYEISRKLNEVSKRAGKYKLDTKVVRVQKEQPVEEVREQVVVEQTVETTETIPHTDTQIKTVEKTPMKATAKPTFEKEYYEAKMQELEEELRDAEKELRLNKSEYVPLTRIYNAYERDSEKLRKKEMQVAKQKVALYGVNSTKVDPAKKAKLDENLQQLAELKDSVAHCEDVIKKNKDRYPVIEKNNQLITKQIQRINDDIKVCEKAIEYYNKNDKKSK